jgi:putative ABC transport system ATP-binding protein
LIRESKGGSVASQPKGSERGDSVVLDVQGLTKVFGSGAASVKAVDGVDLAVRRGEIVLIVGPSGAGKTTLLTMIGGVLKPTSGSVRLNGRDITSMKESELARVRRHLVSFVFQTFNLLESLSAVENVEVALNFAGVTGKEARQRATDSWSTWEWRSGSTSSPASSPGARSSGCPSLGRWPTTRSSSWPMSPPPTWTPATATRWWPFCATSPRSRAAPSSSSPTTTASEVADRILWLEDGADAAAPSSEVGSADV